MIQYFKEQVGFYHTQAIGFAFFLAWNYFSFFSCGLVPILRLIRSSERYWIWAALVSMVAAIVIVSISTRKSLLDKKMYGVLAATLATVGTLIIWFSFFNEATFREVSAVGGMVTGIGYAMMALVWGDRLSRYNESAIEFSAPASFVLSFLIYFVLLALKGPAAMLVNAALPLLSMLFAFRTAPIFNSEQYPPAISGGSLSLRKLGRLLASISTLCLLYGMLWFQFAYFRLLATPDVLGDRFLHYLVPFSCSFVLSIIVFLACLRFSRYLNFTLMFRWGLPLMLLSYAILYYNYSDPTGKILAYTVNFIGMFGVQFSFWISAPKYVRRTNIPPYVVFGALIAAEGLGIFLGTGYGLSIIDGVTAENVMHESLLLFVILLLVTMAVGFNPRWSFSRLGGIDQEERSRSNTPDDALLAENISSLFEQQAQELRDRYGLSQRETEVASLLLAGRSRPYIRDELVISLNTVHSHASNIYTKCEVHSQREFMDLMDSSAKTR